jgi:hypothetical protein
MTQNDMLSNMLSYDVLYKQLSAVSLAAVSQNKKDAGRRAQ